MQSCGVDLLERPPRPRAPAGEPPRQLRIALFSGNYNCVRDGANRALNRLVEHALDRGHAVRVYSPTIATPAFAPAGDLVSVRSIAIPGRSEYRLATGLPAPAAADVRGFAPDLIHVSAPDPLGAGAQHLARELGVPVVASLHTRFETYFGYYGLGFLRSWAERWLATFYGRSDLLLAPNAPIARELAAAHPGREVGVWGRGVDPAEFDPGKRDQRWRAAHGIRQDDVAVLFFGRLVAEKGLGDFAATIERLRHAGCPVRALVVGDGPAGPRFRGQLGDAVFTGQLSGDELGRAVASADVMLSPSTTEAFGNVTLEAMAAGLAVVAADVPSAQALIRDGREGLLVPAGDIAGYAAAIARLAENPVERRIFGQRAWVESRRYRWPEILDGVLASYARLCTPSLARAAA